MHDRASVLLPAVLVAGACALGCGGAGGAQKEDLVVHGQALFEGTCATCHGVEAQGLPNLGKGLHDNDFTRGQSDEQLLAFLKQGRPASHPDNLTRVDMPPKGGNPALTDEDLRAIVAYLRSIA